MLIGCILTLSQLPLIGADGLEQIKLETKTMNVSKDILQDTGNILQDSGQMLVVTTPDWDAAQGTMQMYERDKSGKWIAVNEAFPVVVGRNGLAWGRGLHTFDEEPSLQKKEGDSKSPAGLFALGETFGFALKADAEWIHLPYMHITEKWECVDDVKSQHYNRMIERKADSNADWNSSEKMLAVGEEYRWGIVVKHNMNPVVNGCGSCIFLHIWLDEEKGTSGCTAMERANIETLLRWLVPAKNPLLLQLPESERRMLDED